MGSAFTGESDVDASIPVNGDGTGYGGVVRDSCGELIGAFCSCDELLRLAHSGMHGASGRVGLCQDS